ncbi:MAG: hypothetical protein CR968_06120, partial [Flavobacteriia bacterium]
MFYVLGLPMMLVLLATNQVNAQDYLTLSKTVYPVKNLCNTYEVNLKVEGSYNDRSTETVLVIDGSSSMGSNN